MVWAKKIILAHNASFIKKTYQKLSSNTMSATFTKIISEFEVALISALET